MHKIERIDRNALIESANSVDVARAIGLPITKRGSKYFIPCPAHERVLGKTDHKATNAVLTPKGYYCYACGTKAGLIDMVIEVLHCDAKEAMEVIADTCGGANLFRTTVSEDVVATTSLSQEDIQLLQLTGGNNGASSRWLIGVYDTEPDTEDGTFCIQKSDGYYLYKRVQGWNLLRLYRENEWKFNFMVMQRAQEMRDKYAAALLVFCSRDADKANVVYRLFNKEGGLESMVFSGLQRSFLRKYWRCKELYEEYKEKTAQK